MGTRNLTCVVLDGVFKVAQYGQWDGYPTGQGQTIKEFLAEPGLDTLRFQNNVRACSYATSAELDAMSPKFQASLKELDRLQSEAYGKGDDGYQAYQEQRLKAWLDPQSPLYLSRDVGGNILRVIYEAPRKLCDQRKFAGDGLFCEWAYVVDLDTNVLEIYKGFNQYGPVPRENRFADLNHSPEEIAKFKPSYEGENLYFPPTLVKVIPLTEIADADMAAIEKEIDPDEEEVAVETDA